MVIGLKMKAKKNRDLQEVIDGTMSVNPLVSTIFLRNSFFGWCKLTDKPDEDPNIIEIEYEVSESEY